LDKDCHKCEKEVTRDSIAPMFKATALYQQKEIEVNLKDYKGQWVMLFFYASDFTFV